MSSRKLLIMAVAVIAFAGKSVYAQMNDSMMSDNNMKAKSMSKKNADMKAKTMKGASKFTVRVENISSAEGMTASNGAKFPFALSPGMFVLSTKNNALFTEGKRARANGLEMQAEDGDPTGLVKSLEAMHHATNLHGVFNTPLGAMAAGPIVPGGSYEFSFTAAPGMKLFIAQMFGQSNDWFYAPDAAGIALFDGKGKPLGGDVTDKLVLWNAGTEVDEEIGIGPNQGPRQKGMNAGADEHGVVRRVNDARFTGKNAELFRITITVETGGMM
jgi:hypothetical protein